MLQTSSEGGFLLLSVMQPMLPSISHPMGSTPLSPELPLHPAAAASAGAADPRRGPERRGRQEEQAAKPQAGG